MNRLFQGFRQRDRINLKFTPGCFTDPKSKVKVVYFKWSPVLGNEITAKKRHWEKSLAYRALMGIALAKLADAKTLFMIFSLEVLSKEISC